MVTERQTHTRAYTQREANSVALRSRRNKAKKKKKSERKPAGNVKFFIKYPAHHRPRKLVGAKRNKLDTVLLVLVN